VNTAKVFKTGRSQAVRLPKQCRLDADEVCVAKLDDLVILYPRKKGWDILERGIRSFTPDFMAESDRHDKAEKRAKL